MLREKSGKSSSCYPPEFQADESCGGTIEIHGIPIKNNRVTVGDPAFFVMVLLLGDFVEKSFEIKNEICYTVSFSLKKRSLIFNIQLDSRRRTQCRDHLKVLVSLFSLCLALWLSVS